MTLRNIPVLTPKSTRFLLAPGLSTDWGISDGSIPDILACAGLRLSVSDSVLYVEARGSPGEGGFLLGGSVGGIEGWSGAGLGREGCGGSGGRTRVRCGSGGGAVDRGEAKISHPAGGPGERPRCDGDGGTGGRGTGERAPRGGSLAGADRVDTFEWLDLGGPGWFKNWSWAWGMSILQSLNASNIGGQL